MNSTCVIVADTLSSDAEGSGSRTRTRSEASIIVVSGFKTKRSTGRRMALGVTFNPAPLSTCNVPGDSGGTRRWSRADSTIVSVPCGPDGQQPEGNVRFSGTGNTPCADLSVPPLRCQHALELRGALERRFSKNWTSYRRLRAKTPIT